MSIRKACEKVAKGTDHSADALRISYFRHKDQEHPKAHGNCLLDEQQEMALACVIVAFDIMGRSLLTSTILEMGSAVFHVELDDAWYTRFYSRHEYILAGRKKRGAAPIKNPAMYRKEGLRWVEEIGLFLARHCPPSHAQVNADETRLYEKNGSLYFERMGARGRSESTIDSGGERTVGSYVPFAAADGRMIMSVYVLKADFQGDQPAFGSFYLPDYIRYPTRGAYKWPIYFVYTKSGYLTKSTWKKILEEFEVQWKLIYPGLDCTLWLDYADIHYQPQLILDMASRGILILFFMKKSTKFSQPADQRLFGCLKHCIAKLAAEAKFTVSLHGGSFDGLLWGACFEAERQAFTRDIIRASFEVTGICPWNPDRYMRRLDEALGKAEFKDPVVTMAVGAAEAVLDAHPRQTPRKKHRLVVTEDTPYDVLGIQRQVDDKAQAAKEGTKAKKQKAKAKEERRQKKERIADERKKRKREREEAKEHDALLRAERRRAKDEKLARLRMKRADRATTTAKARKMNTCKGNHAKPRVWRGSTSWGECEKHATCGYTLCPDCWNPLTDGADSEMFKHEKECWGRVK